MIDWVSGRAPYHGPPLHGGRVTKIDSDGVVVFDVPVRMEARSSHETGFMVRSLPDGQIEFSGCPAKWFQGHNIFGTDDLRGLVPELLVSVLRGLGVTLSPSDVAQWRNGDVVLTRVDVTNSFAAGSRSNALAFIRAMESCATLAYRGRGQMVKGDTLYFGKLSRKSSLKIYAKGQELEARGHGLPDSLCGFPLIGFANDLIRFEFVLRSRYLTENGLRHLGAWGDNTATELHRCALEMLSMSNQLTLPFVEMAGLPTHLKQTYALWASGHDCRQTLTRPTFYRHRAELLEHSIDIALVRPVDQVQVVAQLRRVIEAVPVGVPDWAIGTPLYFQPEALAA